MDKFILLVKLEFLVAFVLIIFLGLVIGATNFDVSVIIIIAAILAFILGRFDGIRNERIRQVRADEKEKEVKP